MTIDIKVWSNRSDFRVAQRCESGVRIGSHDSHGNTLCLPGEGIAAVHALLEVHGTSVYVRTHTWAAEDNMEETRVSSEGGSITPVTASWSRIPTGGRLHIDHYSLSCTLSEETYQEAIAAPWVEGFKKNATPRDVSVALAGTGTMGQVVRVLDHFPEGMPPEAGLEVLRSARVKHQESLTPWEWSLIHNPK